MEKCAVCRKILVAGEDDFNLPVPLCSEHVWAEVMKVQTDRCNHCEWEITYRPEDFKQVAVVMLQHRVDCGDIELRIDAVEELFRLVA